MLCRMNYCEAHQMVLSRVIDSRTQDGNLFFFNFLIEWRMWPIFVCCNEQKKQNQKKKKKKKVGWLALLKSFFTLKATEQK